MIWGPECAIEGVATIGGIVCVIRNLLRLIAPLLGIIAVGMVIFSGAKMIAGAGNPKEIAAAQQSLTFAIIGLLGLGLAWLILTVIANLTGAPILTLPTFGN